MQFSPDSARIVTASGDQTAQVWDPASGRVLVTLSGHTSWVRSVQFSPDGTRIVTASNDKTARVWEAAHAKALTMLIGHTDGVVSAQFSPDGARIVTASDDKTARVWDAANGKLLATLWGHTNAVMCAQFSPDSTRILTVSADQTARVWTLLPQDAGPPPDWFADLLRYIARQRFNTEGKLASLSFEETQVILKRLRAALRAGAKQDTPYLQILRRCIQETALSESIRPAASAESAGALQSTAGFAEFADRMPKAFRYNFKGKIDPGYLLWTRSGDAWEEKHPSGEIKSFQTVGRDIVEGRQGTVLRFLHLPNYANSAVFISDKNVDEPRVYFRKSSTVNWSTLGLMEDVK